MRQGREETESIEAAIARLANDTDLSREDARQAWRAGCEALAAYHAALARAGTAQDVLAACADLLSANIRTLAQAAHGAQAGSAAQTPWRPI